MVAMSDLRVCGVWWARYFPNIFKILAWAPRTYLGEFIELLPCLISPSTCVEVYI